MKQDNKVLKNFLFQTDYLPVSWMEPWMFEYWDQSRNLRQFVYVSLRESGTHLGSRL